MKKIHLLVFKAFIRPFLVTFLIVMFVLLMLFVFKYIDDLIGKGFEWYVILELLGYQSVVQISMAMPLSMLLSAIMTFGNLGENYELVAIKAAGVSLRKAMTPLFVVVGLFSGGAFLFSDYVLPVVNLKMGSLLYDVRQKPADFLIKPGIFNNAIQNYSIRANGKSKDGKVLYDLMIYDHSNSNTANNVLIAKEGYVYNSPDNMYMILKLKDGVRYEDSRARNAKVYDPRQQFTRFHFEETEQKFNMEDFQLKRTDEELFKSHHAMLNLRQLEHYTDSVSRNLDSMRHTVPQEIRHYYHYFNDYFRRPQPAAAVTADLMQTSNIGQAPVRDQDSLRTRGDFSYRHSYLERIPRDEQMTLLHQTTGQIGYITGILEFKASEEKAYVDKIIRYGIEWQRKFTLAASCLLLFAIGAPLGAIIRKGGLGLPVVMAIIFFLIYHIISTVAEKSAREGNIDIFVGMWFAIIVLTPLAVFLTYKAATDSALFDLEQYRLRFEKIKSTIARWWKTKFHAA